MSTTSEELRTRLIEVIRDVREQLRYLEALGVTHLEDVSQDPAAITVTELLMSVLESPEEISPSPETTPEGAHSEGESMTSTKRSAPSASAFTSTTPMPDRSIRSPIKPAPRLISCNGCSRGWRGVGSGARVSASRRK
jgi:hypothetical protein